MSKGYGLLFGWTHVDPYSAYGGWDGTDGCEGCEKDIRNIEIDLLLSCCFSPDDITIILNEQGTRERVVSEITAIAKVAKPGDLVVIWRSGHGGQVKDMSGDEKDGMDETWVCWDGELNDDEIWPLLCKFEKGVRIVMGSDSCHSATDFRGRPIRIGHEQSLAGPEDMKASLIHFGGCRDAGTSAGFPDGGAFTMAFTQAFHESEGKINYVEMFVRVSRSIPRHIQRPTINFAGPYIPGFAMQEVFKV